MRWYTREGLYWLAAAWSVLGSENVLRCLGALLPLRWLLLLERCGSSVWKERDRPRRSIAFVIGLGVYCLFVPFFAFGLDWLLWTTGFYFAWNGHHETAFLVAVLVISLLPPYVFARAVYVRLRWKNVPSRCHCEACWYDLTGNISGVCPECGTSVRSEDEESGGEVSHASSGVRGSIAFPLFLSLCMLVAFPLFVEQVGFYYLPAWLILTIAACYGAAGRRPKRRESK